MRFPCWQEMANMRTNAQNNEMNTQYTAIQGMPCQ